MFKDKLQALMKSGEGKGKKNIENMVVFIIILIVTIIIINMVWGNTEETEQTPTQNGATKLVSTDTEETMANTDDTEKNIKQILSKIN